MGQRGNGLYACVGALEGREAQTVGVGAARGEEILVEHTSATRTVADAPLCSIKVGVDALRGRHVPLMGVLVLGGVVPVVEGEVHLSLSLYANALALGIGELQPAQVLTVTAGLGACIVDVEVAHALAVDTQVGALLAVYGVVPRAAGIVAGLRELGIKLHGHADAAQIGASDRVGGLEVYGTIGVGCVAHHGVAERARGGIDDGVALGGACGLRDAIVCGIVGIGAVRGIILYPSIVAIGWRGGCTGARGDDVDTTCRPRGDALGREDDA